MTKDYTNISKTIADTSDKAAVQEKTNVSSSDAKPTERICTQCYDIGIPKIMEHGSWPKFILLWVIFWPLLLVVKFITLVFLKPSEFEMTEKKDYSLSNLIFNKLPVLPEEPYKIYGCKKCGHPNSMVPLASREGEHAMYWHIKSRTDRGLQDKK